jgi:hypothetical protein
MIATITTNQLGEFAVVKVQERAFEKGVVVSRPTIECRYDLIVDDHERLYRTQVKYAGSLNGAARGHVAVGLRKWRNDGRAVIPCYRAAEIDLLLVYVAVIDRVLAFGPEVFDGRGALCIRIRPSRNNQIKGCLMADDYIW